MVEPTESSTQSHNEASVDICSGKHTVNSNITKGNIVQSEEASPNIHVKATVEHTSGKHTVILPKAIQYNQKKHHQIFM